jgi:hypothetical protein
VRKTPFMKEKKLKLEDNINGKKRYFILLIQCDKVTRCNELI